MKVKDLYWAARNSTFFINLESEGRPLLCGPKCPRTACVSACGCATLPRNGGRRRDRPTVSS